VGVCYITGEISGSIVALAAVYSVTGVERIREIPTCIATAAVGLLPPAVTVAIISLFAALGLIGPNGRVEAKDERTQRGGHSGVHNPCRAKDQKGAGDPAPRSDLPTYSVTARSQLQLPSLIRGAASFAGGYSPAPLLWNALR
jgi:hypothetical protein